MSLVDAQAKMGAWKAYYNESGPHSALAVGHTRRIRPALLPAGSNGDVKEAGSSYFRAVVEQVQDMPW